MADNKGLNDCQCGQSVHAQTRKTEDQSFAMMMLQESTQNAKRWFAIAMTILVMWLVTIGAFLVYLNQFEILNEEYNVEQNTDGGGNIADSYVGVNGDVINGLPKNNTN